MDSILMKQSKNSTMQMPMRKPILYILCGIPGSGKSTFAEKLMRDKADEDIRYVSRDEIRFHLLKEGEDYFSHEDEVYDRFVGTIANTLIDGFDVIADATHCNHGSRAKLYNYLRLWHMPPEDYDVVFIQMTTSFEECMKRNDLREGVTHVPKSVMKRMWAQSTYPTKHEFSNVKDVIYHE